MFLSGNIIAEQGGNWITPFDPRCVDGAAYTMPTGDEAFVSPQTQSTRKPGLLQRLNPGTPIVIPPGQFAYLTTREFVCLPYNFVGFINMRSGLKMSGLVNVSGSDIDPGYYGKCLFAAFTAGPQSISVRSDQLALLIWFARLDRATMQYLRRKAVFKDIDTALMGNLPAENASLSSLEKRIDDLSRRVSYFTAIYVLIASILTGTIAALIVIFFSDVVSAIFGG